MLELCRELVDQFCRHRSSQQESDVDRIANTLLGLYLDLPADADPDSGNPFAFFAARTRNVPLLTPLLYGKALRHLYLHTQTNRLEGGHNLRRKNGLHPGLSRLHCLMTTELDDDHGRIGVYRKVLRNHRGLMRETCYSARNFKSRNDWGPFTPQGKVEWGLLNALSTVMSEFSSLVRSSTVWGSQCSAVAGCLKG